MSHSSGFARGVSVDLMLCREGLAAVARCLMLNSIPQSRCTTSRLRRPLRIRLLTSSRQGFRSSTGTEPCSATNESTTCSVLVSSSARTGSRIGSWFTSCSWIVSRSYVSARNLALKFPTSSRSLDDDGPHHPAMVATVVCVGARHRECEREARACVQVARVERLRTSRDVH